MTRCRVPQGVPLSLLVLCASHALRAPTPVSEVYRRFASLDEGKHVDARVSIRGVVTDAKRVSARLTFLRVRDDEAGAASPGPREIELLLRERDGFLTEDDIAGIARAAARPGAVLSARAFPERLSDFDGPSFFPQLPPPARGGVPVCLHVVAADVAPAAGARALVWAERAPRAAPVARGRMPGVGAPGSNARGGAKNRDRGGAFAAWALEAFGARLMRRGVLDVAGGSGQLAFQLGVRRGLNTTVVDPRALRLDAGQQRTLAWHRASALRPAPEGRDPTRPPSDYGHHFRREDAAASEGDVDVSWLVARATRVRHVRERFDARFVAETRADVWAGCGVVLGMHPDEATEDIVDLALAHDKPFAVVPCCVFARRSPHRRTAAGKPVRSWEDFCEYLAEKDGRIRAASLPFPGRNVALYFNPG